MESKGNSALATDLCSDELKNCRSNPEKSLLSLSNPCGPMEQLIYQQTLHTRLTVFVFPLLDFLYFF